MTIETREKCAKNLLKQKLTKICTKNCTKIFQEWLEIKGCEVIHGSSIPPCLIFSNFHETAKTRVLRTVEPFFFFLKIEFNLLKMQKITLKSIFSSKIAPRFAPKIFGGFRKLSEIQTSKKSLFLGSIGEECSLIT